MQDKKAELEKQIMNLVESDEVIISTVYDFLEKEEKHGLALQIFLENVDSKKLSCSLGNAEEQELENNYAKMIEGMVDALIERHLQQIDFYNELWEKVIFKNPMFDKQIEKEYALYKIGKNKRIPYYNLPEGMKMTEEVFADYLKELQVQIKQIRFIMRSPFDQKTERMSLLYEILKSVEKDEHKVVLLSIAYTEIQIGIVEQLMRESMKMQKREDDSVQV